MISRKDVWTVHQVLVVTFAKEGKLVLTFENNIIITQRTLRNVKARPYFREISISFLWVRGYNKLNQFNEGNLIFADGDVATSDDVAWLYQQEWWWWWYARSWGKIQTVHRSMGDDWKIADELSIQRTCFVLEDYFFFSLYSFSCIA